ncbi:kinase-like domain-containing protein [Aspergillus alliaceus]|uniref:Kinase-like domain-containing protein n=1 Tax=Petromyces alliaceus TaxID=209559 RepID=A0A5N7CF57_PETAA|nr:kinase-like domain-containing protein [Aspergillus alliaceus]
MIYFIDIKPENIIVTFEDPVVLNDFMNSQLESPMQYKIDPTGRPVYRCHNGSGPIREPGQYRAPEVILGCGWKTSTDIWNLAHLAETIALLGLPPSELVTRAYSMLDHKLPESLRGEDGKFCESSEQYFEGPFFDRDTIFLHNDLTPNQTLADALPFLEEKERENFLSFIKMMMARIPEERKTARELVEHPFLRLKNVNKSPNS